MTGEETAPATARHTFGLRLEQARLRCMLTIEQGRPEQRQEMLGRLRARLAAIEAALAAAGDDTRARRLAATAALSPDELELLWTVTAACADARLPPHAQVLMGSEARRGGSLALHAMIAALDGERTIELGLALGPGGALRRHHLLVPAEGGPVAASCFVVPHRLIAHLAGDDAVDPELLAAGGLVGVPDDLIFDDAQRAVCERLGQALGAPEPAVLIVGGPWGVGKSTAVAARARALGREVVELDVRRIAPTVEALESALVALRRECLLRGALPLVAGADDLLAAEGASDARLRALGRALDEHDGPVVVTVADAGVDLGVRRRVLRLSLTAPDTAARQRLWRRALERRAGDVAATDEDITGIALRYRLGAGGIERAVTAAVSIADSGGDRAPLGASHLIAGVRNDIAERLGGLAQRIEVRQSWEDLVLATDTLDQVRALVGRVRHAHTVLEQWGFHQKLARGQGVAALFSGPPGTGKTMVAGLLARDLELELYQVDLSKVVSKWVGETERQLARIFEAAEAGHALLLFDEADALFAKRTEVKAAVDRYANLEVNYLLQRIESFGGITVLTTNMDTSIDPALRRRLAAHITFWSPEHDERVALWKTMIPAKAPVVEPLDFDALADEFPEMSGANIRNAAVAAAFLAAAEGVTLTQSHLARAAAGEYRSMGHLLSKR